MAHWKLDEGSGTIASDSSGNAHHGTASGAAWIQGYVAGALAFDGVDDSVAVAHANALNAYPLTAAAWFRTASTSGVKGIVNKYGVGAYNGYQVFMDSGRLCAWFIRDQVNHVYDGSDCTFGVTGYADGEWHQVALVVDGTGGKLFVDGVLKGTQAWTGAAGAVTTTQGVTLGDYPGVAGGGYFLGDVDQVRLYRGALTAAQVADLYAADAGVDLIFADGFESGSLAAWSRNAVDGGDLRASSAAALASTAMGADGLIDDQTALYVQDDRPGDESRYRARFYVDPSRFDPGEHTAAFRTRVFLAFDEAPQRRLVAIVLRRMSGQYGLMGTTRLDDGTQVDAGFFPITAGPHAVEFDWRRSSAPGVNNGLFQLWIDGVLVASLPNLDNDSSGVDFVRLGALSIKQGASGNLYWDEFVSRRKTYIGPRP